MKMIAASWGGGPQTGEAGKKGRVRAFCFKKKSAFTAEAEDFQTGGGGGGGPGGGETNKRWAGGAGVGGGPEGRDFSRGAHPQSKAFSSKIDFEHGGIGMPESVKPAIPKAKSRPGSGKARAPQCGGAPSPGGGPAGGKRKIGLAASSTNMMLRAAAGM